METADSDASARHQAFMAKVMRWPEIWGEHATAIGWVAIHWNTLHAILGLLYAELTRAKKPAQ